MLFYIAHLLVVGISALVVLKCTEDFKYRFGKCIFFASYGLIFGVAPIMQSADSYVNTFGDQARTDAGLAALGGLVALLFGFVLADWPSGRIAVGEARLWNQIAQPANQQMLRYLFWLAIGLTILGQFLMMNAKGLTFMDVLLGGRFEHRFTNRSAITVLATHMTSFAYVPAFVGMFLDRRYRILSLVYVLLAGAVFFLLFSKGTRSIPMAMVMTLLVAGSIRFRFSQRHVIYTGAAGVLFVVLALLLSELRKHQTASGLPSLEQMLSSDTYQTIWDRDPLNYSTNLVGAVATFPQYYPYLEGATYRRMPVFFLKEADFPEIKPPDTNIVFGLVVHGRSEDLQVTVPPTIVGDVYVNFWGWWGLPVLILHGMLYCWMFRFMRTHLIGFVWIGPLCGRFLLLVHRGEPYEMFCLFVVFLGLMLAAFSVCRFLSSPRKRRRQAVAPSGIRISRQVSR
jgi:hypothetical protein